MKQKITILILAALLSGFAALAQVDTGDADFTRFYALGDSLMSGESSTSLVQTFQVSSPPALLYGQVNGTDEGFEAPWISEAGIPIRLVLGPSGPVRMDQLYLGVEEGVPLNDDYDGTYTNMGISGGARVFDLLAVGQVSLADPTFVALWIGGNDVLGAAVSGTVIDGVTMTPVDDFETYYRAVVDILTDDGAGMAMANVPDVDTIAFVNTIPPYVVNPGTGMPVPLLGPDGVPLSEVDKVTLVASAYLEQGCGIPGAMYNPMVCPDGYLPGSVILDVGEQDQLTDRVNDYNEIIAEIAAENGAALFDFNSFLTELNQDGLELGGITYTTDFVTGGLFSFDGVHPNPIAMALNANGLLEAINETYNASIPLVDLGPFVFDSVGYIGPPPLPVPLGAEAVEQLRNSLVIQDFDEVDLGSRGSRHVLRGEREAGQGATGRLQRRHGSPRGR